MRISDWSSDVCSSDLSPAYFPFRSSAPMSTDPETIDPETEAASLIETCAAALEAAEELAGQARAALADHVTNNGRIERAAMEEHQFACHGLAWIAPYVETLRDRKSVV